MSMMSWCAVSDLSVGGGDGGEEGGICLINPGSIVQKGRERKGSGPPEMGMNGKYVCLCLNSKFYSKMT